MTDIQQLQTVEVTHSPRGRRLKAPLVLTLPEPASPGEERLRRYVIDALSWKMPALVEFTLGSPALTEVARHLLRHCTGSTATLYQYVYGVHRYCAWASRTPDELVAACRDLDGVPNPRAMELAAKALDDFVGDLQAEDLAPGTISNHVKSVKALYRAAGLRVELLYRLSKRVIYADRSPRPEELQRLLDLGTLRDRVIILLLALGGFRVGTLVRLQYRHVRRDLEARQVPVHVHVEAEITKGKYADYDTFLGEEAAEALRLYLEKRRAGSPEGRTPPEEIQGDSPLIRDGHSVRVRPITEGRVHSIVNNLLREAGLIEDGDGPRYDLRVHSIRKYFRTQLAALGVNRDYIEYMMGHKVSTYHDVKMKGVEFLRNIYHAAGLSVRPRTRISKIDALKEIIRAWGMNPEEILTKQALSSPHAVYVGPAARENDQIRALSAALRDQMKREILEGEEKRDG
jgi:integrase